MKTEHTERGFAYQKFEDQYGEKCSIQKSSLATEDCIWFGFDEINLKHFVPFRTPESWQDVDLDKLLGVTPDNRQSDIANSRMHLSRDMVADLLPVLQHFVDTGELPE